MSLLGDRQHRDQVCSAEAWHRLTLKRVSRLFNVAAVIPRAPSIRGYLPMWLPLSPQMFDSRRPRVAPSEALSLGSLALEAHEGKINDKSLSLVTVGNRTGMGSPHLEWIQPRVQACEVAFNHEFRIKHKQKFCQSEISLCLILPLICSPLYLLVLTCVIGFDCILKRCFLTTGTFSRGTRYLSEKGAFILVTTLQELMWKKRYEAPFQRCFEGKVPTQQCIASNVETVHRKLLTENWFEPVRLKSLDRCSS